VAAAAVDFDAERQLGEILVAASRDGMLSAAHDLSDGGLAQAMVESCLHGGMGARIVLPETPTRSSWLFSGVGRSPSSRCRGPRSCGSWRCARRAASRRRASASWTATRSSAGRVRRTLADLRAAWEGTLPAPLG
jgi:phosphoribosylformylglycinamidine synthase